MKSKIFEKRGLTCTICSWSDATLNEKCFSSKAVLFCSSSFSSWEEKKKHQSTNCSIFKKKKTWLYQTLTFLLIQWIYSNTPFWLALCLLKLITINNLNTVYGVQSVWEALSSEWSFICSFLHCCHFRSLPAAVWRSRQEFLSPVGC